MSEEKPISFFFEPLRFIVRSTSREVTTSRRTVIRRRIWGRDSFEDVHAFFPESGGYFFQKAIVQNTKDFETIDVFSEIRKFFNKGVDNTLERLKEKLGAVIPSSDVVNSIISKKTHEHYSLPRLELELPRAVYFHKTKPVVIIPTSPSLIYLLGPKAEGVKEVIAKIRRECEGLSKVTSDFGLKLISVLTSREYQENLLTSLENIDSIEIGKSKNDFEKEVIQEVGRFTTSFLPNVTIKYTKPVENFEYDLFLGFSRKSRVIIEPTDYESLKSELQDGKFGKETLKSKVILGTLDKARRLQAESVIVTKGFSKQQLSALKSLADSRGVGLMSDENYKIRLPSFLLGTLREVLTPR